MTLWQMRLYDWLRKIAYRLYPCKHLGTPTQAIMWAHGYDGDVSVFLSDWIHGDLDDYPEYAEWLESDIAKAYAF